MTIDVSLLDELTKTGDAEADEAVKAWFDDDDDLTYGGTFKQVHDHRHVVPADQAASVQAFLDRPDALPSWYDPAVVARGQAVFAAFAPQIGMGLFCASLPAGYAAAVGAEVLAGTGELVGHTKERIFETAQMVSQVMDPGGFEPGGSAYVTIRRIRMMHGAVRHLLIEDGWDTEARGVPVHQEHLLATLYTFCLVPLDVVSRFGVRLKDSERDDFLHLWSVVGHLIGIDDRVLPVRYDEAVEAFQLIKVRNYAPSQSGNALTKALTEVIDGMIPFRLLNGLAASALRECNADDVLANIDVPPANWTRSLFVPVRVFTRYADKRQKKSRAASAAWGALGRAFFQGIIDAETEGKRASFEPPMQLTKRTRKARMAAYADATASPSGSPG